MGSWRRRAVAARCSRFRCAFRQNQNGSLTNAGEGDDCVTQANYGIDNLKFRAMAKFEDDQVCRVLSEARRSSLSLMSARIGVPTMVSAAAMSWRWSGAECWAHLTSSKFRHPPLISFGLLRMRVANQSNKRRVHALGRRGEATPLAPDCSLDSER
jgi:hypothetical protein